MPVGGEVPLSPPPPEEDVQDSMVPVAPSARTTERDATAMAPPGVTVKVLSTATAAPAPMPVTRAVAAPVSRTAPACRFQVAIGPLLGLVCAVPRRSGFRHGHYVPRGACSLGQLPKMHTNVQRCMVLPAASPERGRCDSAHKRVWALSQ